MNTELKSLTPAARRERLLERVGRWDVDCEFFRQPGRTLRLAAQEEVQAVGELWTLSTFRAQVDGRPLLGHATLGFDAWRERWVSTWVDSFLPSLLVFEGDLDLEGEVLALVARGPDPALGRETGYRSEETRLSRDQRRYELFMTLPDGQETHLLRYRYARRT